MDDTQKPVVGADDQDNEQDDFDYDEEESIDDADDEEEEDDVDEEGEPDEEDEESEDEDSATEDEDSATEDDKELPKKEEKKSQSAEDNAKFAAARREAESAAKASEGKLSAIYAKAGVNTFEELMGLTNPEALQKNAESAGLQSDKAVEEKIKDDFFKNLMLQNAAKAEQEKLEKAKKEKIQNELGEFVGTYPNIDPKRLLADENFKLFSKGKLGDQTLREVYEDYTKLVGTAQKKGAESYARKEERSTSSSKGSAQSSLSPRQKRMLDEWNKANPDNPMTEEEFLKS